MHYEQLNDVPSTIKHSITHIRIQVSKLGVALYASHLCHYMASKLAE